MIAYPRIFVKQILLKILRFFLPILHFPSPFADSFALLSFCPTRKPSEKFFLFSFILHEFCTYLSLFLHYPPFVYHFFRIFAWNTYMFLRFTIFCTIRGFSAYFFLNNLSISNPAPAWYTRFTKLRNLQINLLFLVKSDLFRHFFFFQIESTWLWLKAIA